MNLLTIIIILVLILIIIGEFVIFWYAIPYFNNRFSTMTGYWKCKKCGKIYKKSIYVGDGYCKKCKEYHLLERYDPLNPTLLNKKEASK